MQAASAFSRLAQRDGLRRRNAVSSIAASAGEVQFTVACALSFQSVGARRSDGRICAGLQRLVAIRFASTLGDAVY